jgi:hypothetical protein
VIAQQIFEKIWDVTFQLTMASHGCTHAWRIGQNQKTTYCFPIEKNNRCIPTAPLSTDGGNRSKLENSEPTAEQTSLQKTFPQM